MIGTHCVGRERRQRKEREKGDGKRERERERERYTHTDLDFVLCDRDHTHTHTHMHTHMDTGGGVYMVAADVMLVPISKCMPVSNFPRVHTLPTLSKHWLTSYPSPSPYDQRPQSLSRSGRLSLPRANSSDGYRAHVSLLPAIARFTSTVSTRTGTLWIRQETIKSEHLSFVAWEKLTSDD